MIERLHPQMKAAMKCHETEAWAEIFRTILLGIRAAIKEDMKASPAELVYGTIIRLPGEFFQVSKSTNNSDFVEDLRKIMRALEPVQGTRHGMKNVSIYKELFTSSHTLVCHDAVCGPLQHTYDGPFEVLDRNEKTYTATTKTK